jgi:hypothetical protein
MMEKANPYVSERASLSHLCKALHAEVHRCLGDKRLRRGRVAAYRLGSDGALHH